MPAPVQKSILIVILGLAAFALTGCSPTTPATTADNAAITAETAQLTSLGQQLAAVKSAITAAATQPAATQPTAADPTPLLSELQSQSAALQSQIQTVQAQQTASTNQLHSDVATAQAAAAQQATQVANAVAAAAPGPWTAIINLLGLGIVAYFGAKANTAQSANHAAATGNAVTAGITAAINALPISELPANVQSIASAAQGVVDTLTGSTPAPPKV